MIPSDFVSLSHTLNEYLRQHMATPGTETSKETAVSLSDGSP